VAVHATGGQQAEDVNRLARLDRFVHRPGQRRVGEKRAGLDGTADAGELLIDHPPGPKIEVRA